MDPERTPPHRNRRASAARTCLAGLQDLCRQPGEGHSSDQTIFCSCCLHSISGHGGGRAHCFDFASTRRCQFEPTARWYEPCFLVSELSFRKPIPLTITAASGTLTQT